MMSNKRALMLTNETETEREARRFKYQLTALAVITAIFIVLTAGGTYAWDDIFEQDAATVIETAGVTEQEITLEAVETVYREPPAAKNITYVESKVSAPVLKSFDTVPLSAEFQNFVFNKAEDIGIDPAVIFGMMYHESRFDTDAVGDDGRAIGILQVRVDVHGERIERLGCSDMTDPYECVTVALDYLSYLLQKYGGDVAAALTAYNRGHYNGAVSRYAELVIEQSIIIKGGK